MNEQELLKLNEKEKRDHADCYQCNPCMTAWENKIEDAKAEVWKDALHIIGRHEISKDDFDPEDPGSVGFNEAVTAIWDAVDAASKTKAQKEKTKMGHHLTAEGKFKSDKYEWCKEGFFALKLTDPVAQEAALKYATSLARDSGAMLVILHVEELPTPYATWSQRDGLARSASRSICLNSWSRPSACVV